VNDDRSEVNKSNEKVLMSFMSDHNASFQKEDRPKIYEYISKCIVWWVDGLMDCVGL
jgi:hypothetical protein